MNARKLLMLALAVILLGGMATMALLADDDATNAAAKTDEALQNLLKQQLRTLVYDRVKTATSGVEATQAAYNAGTITLDVLIQTMTGLRDAELANSETIEAELAALEKHLLRLRPLERRILALYQEESKGGSAAELAQVQFAHQSAEIELLEARLAASR